MDKDIRKLVIACGLALLVILLLVVLRLRGHDEPAVAAKPSAAPSVAAVVKPVLKPTFTERADVVESAAAEAMWASATNVDAMSDPPDEDEAADEEEPQPKKKIKKWRRRKGGPEKMTAEELEDALDDPDDEDTPEDDANDEQLAKALQNPEMMAQQLDREDREEAAQEEKIDASILGEDDGEEME